FAGCGVEHILRTTAGGSHVPAVDEMFDTFRRCAHKESFGVLFADWRRCIETTCKLLSNPMSYDQDRYKKHLWSDGGFQSASRFRHGRAGRQSDARGREIASDPTGSEPADQGLAKDAGSDVVHAARQRHGADQRWRAPVAAGRTSADQRC